MKKSFILAGLLVGLTATAQYEKRVGINTTTPRASLEVKAVTPPDGRVQGILFPHISDEEKDNWEIDENKGLVAGTVIWNTDKKCLDYFDGTLWQCVDGSQKSAPPDTPITLPQGLDISSGQHWIVSIYDTQYLPHTVPAVAASWTKGEAGGPDPLIDIKGKIPAAGITVQIPIKATGNTTLPAYTAYAITPAEAWEDKTVRLLEMSWVQQSVTASSTSITATIKVKNATTDQYLTQLDIEKGLGNEYTGLLLGQFKMPSGYTETTPNAYTETYDVRVISGIPDRNFGKETQLTGSATAELLHQFIYLPVKAEDGKIWLNNNLGAEYADVRNLRGNFDPAQQATSASDYKAFGSLFQWQRQADGHELITWDPSNLSGSTKSWETTTLASNWEPSHSDFILATTFNSWSWTTATTPTDYWQSGGQNNPCPTGFHIPTQTEWDNLQNASDGSQDYNWWASRSSLKLPSAGMRYHHSMGLNGSTEEGLYWSSDPGNLGYGAMSFFIQDNYISVNQIDRADGLSVRCLKD